MNGEPMNDPVERVEVTDEKKITVVHTRAPIVPYRVQWGLTFVLVILSAVLNAAIVMDPMALGISPVVKNWLTLANVAIVAAQGFLPRMINPPDPARTGLD